MKKGLLAIIVIIIIAIAGYAYMRANEEALTIDISNRDLGMVPDLTFNDFEGNAVSLADFRGTPMVVNAWATWCPFCKDELPDFVTVQKELGDQIVIIAVDRRESVETQKKYTDDIGISNDLIFLSDPDDSLYKAIGGFSMPETIFVDADGRIQEHKKGVMQLSEIRAKTAALLSP